MPQGSPYGMFFGCPDWMLSAVSRPLVFPCVGRCWTPSPLTRHVHTASSSHQWSLFLSRQSCSPLPVFSERPPNTLVVPLENTSPPAFFEGVRILRHSWQALVVDGEGCQDPSHGHPLPVASVPTPLLAQTWATWLHPEPPFEQLLWR